MDCSTYELDLSVYRFDLTRYLDGQPLQVCHGTACLNVGSHAMLSCPTARPLAQGCCVCWSMHGAEHRGNSLKQVYATGSLHAGNPVTPS